MDDIYIDIGDINEPVYGKASKDAERNAETVSGIFKNSFDIPVKRGYCGRRKVIFIHCDGLCDSMRISKTVIEPMMRYEKSLPDDDTDVFIMDNVIRCSEQKSSSSINEAVSAVLRGNLIVFIDGTERFIIVGVQDIPERSIEEPDSEVQEFGSREGFTENIKTNLALVRKRLCTCYFTGELIELGKTSKTRLLVCSIDNKVDEKILAEIKARLEKIELDTLFGAGYIRSALDTKRPTFFSMVGRTQRPDTFCAKLNEGKVGIIVDGTPFALVLPCLFIENFQTMDDYLNRPFFAFLMRSIRLFSFLAGIFLPGIYVAAGLFHQELIPDDMLLNIVVMESNTFFSLTTEALIIHFIYEAVREAGLRMPKSVGHAVSIVGAIVVGDAAVSAGVIGAPMLIIVAMTAICSLVVSDLYQPVSVLRMVFIIAGGFVGLYGIMAGAVLLVVNLASVNDYGVNFLSPLTPYNKALFRDTVTRAPFSELGKKLFTVNSAGGVNE